MPKSVDVEEKRAEFVRASWDVIAAEGFEAATMRRVASEAGCTTGSLTHYFADRRSLLIEALRSAHFQAGERMGKVAEEGSPFERLHAVLLESLPLDSVRMREWKVWLAFWGASINDPAIASEDAKRYAEWRALLENLLTPLSQDPEHEADLIIALVDGLGIGLARAGFAGAALKRKQSECEAALNRYLGKFND